MEATIACTACGLGLDEPKGPCPRCGGTVNVSVQLTGQAAIASVGSVGALVDELRETHHALRYTSPSGIRSSIKVVHNDRVEMHVAPRSSKPLDIGRQGEERVADRIRAQLASEGRSAVIDGGDDARGVDRVLIVDVDRVPLQVVTVPNDETFWSPRGCDEASTTRAIEWLHAAITSKSSRYGEDQRKSMILALDVLHAGLLAEEATASAYLKKYGDPREEFGFGSVWLVGPTDKYCRRLGASRW